MTIIATTTDHDTDEDSEISSRVTRSVFDHFIRRPSLEDKALEAIITMANNDLLMLSSSDEKAPCVDAAFVFIHEGQARFLISGRSSAFLFTDGKLVKRSQPRETALIGSGVNYRPVLEPAFSLGEENNAVLVTSAGLTDAVSDEDIANALQQSKDPNEWMERLASLANGKDFCAITTFLPPRKSTVMSKILDKIKK